MKKIILSALVLSFTIAATAQEIPERKTERPAIHDRMKHKGKGNHDMIKELNLTDAQKQQMKAQREEFRGQLSALKKNDNITVKEWKSKMEGLRKEQKAKMDGILTSEQKATMEKMKTEGKAKHESRMKERGEQMKKELGLSADQSAKMEKNRAEMGKQLKTIREDKTLTDEQKKEKSKELMKQQKEKTKSILTEEQQKKMKEMREHKPRMEGKKTDTKVSTI
jgi:Spy/CpxP family protein refolding chaperone